MTTTILLCLSMACLMLSYKYHLANQRLSHSGRIPDIITTQNKKSFFLAITILSLTTILFTQYINAPFEG